MALYIRSLPMLTILSLVEIKMNEDEKLTVSKQNKPVTQLLCTMIITISMTMITLLAICAGIFLTIISCIRTMTDKIIQVLDT